MSTLKRKGNVVPIKDLSIETLERIAIYSNTQLVLDKKNKKKNIFFYFYLLFVYLQLNIIFFLRRKIKSEIGKFE